jgi:hypothetical protein
MQKDANERVCEGGYMALDGWFVVQEREENGENVMQGTTGHTTETKAVAGAQRTINYWLRQGYRVTGPGVVTNGEVTYRITVESGRGM